MAHTATQLPGRKIVETADARITCASTLCSGAIAAVLGGSGGLGTAVCDVLHATGARVYSLQRRLRRRASAEDIRCDIDDPESVASSISRIEMEGPIDLLINCAGLYTSTDIRAADLSERLQASLSTNFAGPVALVGRSIGGMLLRRRGLIVNVCSSWADANAPSKGALEYKASKAALEVFTLTLQEELAGTGVEALVYKPPQLATPMTGFRGVDPLVGAVEILDLVARYLHKQRRQMDGAHA